MHWKLILDLAITLKTSNWLRQCPSVHDVLNYVSFNFKFKIWRPWCCVSWPSAAVKYTWC
jgi:hypothetical protein